MLIIKKIIDLGGGPLIVRYGSLSLLLSAIYSKHSCSYVGDIWKDEQFAKYFVESLKSEAEVAYVHKIIQKMGYKQGFPLTELLKASFPQFTWETVKNKKTQFILKEYLDKLLIGEGILCFSDYS